MFRGKVPLSLQTPDEVLLSRAPVARFPGTFEDTRGFCEDDDNRGINDRDDISLAWTCNGTKATSSNRKVYMAALAALSSTGVWPCFDGIECSQTDYVCCKKYNKGVVVGLLAFVGANGYDITATTTTTNATALSRIEQISMNAVVNGIYQSLYSRDGLLRELMPAQEAIAKSVIQDRLLILGGQVEFALRESKDIDRQTVLNMARSTSIVRDLALWLSIVYRRHQRLDGGSASQLTKLTIDSLAEKICHASRFRDFRIIFASLFGTFISPHRLTHLAQEYTDACPNFIVIPNIDVSEFLVTRNTVEQARMGSITAEVEWRSSLHSLGERLENSLHHQKAYERSPEEWILTLNNTLDTAKYPDTVATPAEFSSQLSAETGEEQQWKQIQSPVSVQSCIDQGTLTSATESSMRGDEQLISDQTIPPEETLAAAHEEAGPPEISQGFSQSFWPSDKVQKTIPTYHQAASPRLTQDSAQTNMSHTDSNQTSLPKLGQPSIHAYIDECHSGQNTATSMDLSESSEIHFPEMQHIQQNFDQEQLPTSQPDEIESRIALLSDYLQSQGVYHPASSPGACEEAKLVRSSTISVLEISSEPADRSSIAESVLAPDTDMAQAFEQAGTPPILNCEQVVIVPCNSSAGDGIVASNERQHTQNGQQQAIQQEDQQQQQQNTQSFSQQAEEEEEEQDTQSFLQQAVEHDEDAYLSTQPTVPQRNNNNKRSLTKYSADSSLGQVTPRKRKSQCVERLYARQSPIKGWSPMKRQLRKSEHEVNMDGEWQKTRQTIHGLETVVLRGEDSPFKIAKRLFKD
ncbi:protein of unknown function [Taphrina deformans PYCC 5710]|uniref:Uncharacterized protein n=1 Tax=Taphrina deformans (strain PYCC 5710 / ATCC 11124 / CBS 356.35 / IMI 108563 / JCM 9778 / NBRC 8474) TaxID=1097556 RepID=R4X694_TAPDE|nr:protein of unknown function [Taphrina deformans PYCC 5710]|eukprot:CCG80505.1 protein of unknown function [Taphrina deformans PYCC 5710]